MRYYEVCLKVLRYHHQFHQYHHTHLVEVAVFVSVIHTEHDCKKGTFSQSMQKRYF